MSQSDSNGIPSSTPMDTNDLSEPWEENLMGQGPTEPLDGPTGPPAGIEEEEGSEPTMLEEPQKTTSQDAVSPLLQVGSTTLSKLPQARQPKPSTVCEHCPASMWQATPLGLKCYCRIMHVFSWTTAEPVELIHCDGIAIASA